MTTSPFETRTRIEQRILADPLAVLDVADAEVDALTDEDVEYLRAAYGGTTLLRLPPRERAFFDWVKREDPDVWRDLWEDDEDMLVTLAFLGDLRKGGLGFTICELEQADNYYFTARHLKPDGLAALRGIIDRAARNKELSVAEGLLFDIVAAPTDIWHFCYRHGVALERAKRAVAELDALGWLVHLTSAEDLAKYLED